MTTRAKPFAVGDTLGGVLVLDIQNERQRALVRYACCGKEEWVSIQTVHQRRVRGRSMCVSCARKAQGTARRLGSQPVSVECGARVDGIIRAGQHYWWTLSWRNADTDDRRNSPGYEADPKKPESPLMSLFGNWHLGFTDRGS